MTLLARQTPREAYRRVDFDARVEGADPAQLVGVCCDQLVDALGTAIHAAQAGDNLLKSRSLTRALAAITALELGISGNGDMAASLHTVYGAARRAVLGSVLDFDAARLGQVRDDFTEIGRALQAAS